MVSIPFVSVADINELEAKLGIAPCALEEDKYLEALNGQARVYQSDFERTLLALAEMKFNLIVDYPDLEDEDREALISEVFEVLNTLIDELYAINVKVNLPNT